MSTAINESTPRAAPTIGAPQTGATRIYRGRTVEELIPRIQAELGADAIVVRREKGLTGGLAGFFQRPFVEIEARAGAPRVDLYDEDDAAPALPPPREQSPDTLGRPRPRLESTPSAPEPAPMPPASPAATAQTSTLPTPAPQTPAPQTPTPYTALSAPQTPTSHAPAPPTRPPHRPPRGAYGGDPLALLNGVDSSKQFRELTPASFLERATNGNGHAAQIPNPFAAALAEAEAAVLPATETQPASSDGEPAQASAQPAPVQAAAAIGQPDPAREPGRAQIEASLLDCGVGEPLVRDLIEIAAAHTLPLMPPRASLADAVQRTIEQLIPAVPQLPVGYATIAVVGPGGSGKTAICAALLDAYRERSTLPAACATVLAGETPGAYLAQLSPAVPEPTAIATPELAQALRVARAQGLLLLDLPALAPGNHEGIEAAAALLRSLQPDRVIVALPAPLGAKPATQLLEALRPLGASALAITHADETDQLGVAMQAACAFDLAPEYLLDRGGLTKIDAASLAEKLLPSV